MRNCAAVLFALAGAASAQARPGDVGPGYYPFGPQCHCPKGYNNRNNQCQAIIEVNKLPFCPYEEVKQFPGQCLRQVPSVRVCPSGYNWVPKVGCVKVTTEDPQPKCPPSFESSNGVCQKTIQIPQVMICEADNAVLEGEGCLSLTPATTLFTCPGGDDPSDGEICTYTQSGRFRLKCPIGFELDGDLVCRRVDFAPTITSCKAHFGSKAILQPAASHAGGSPKGTCAVQVDYPCGVHPGHRRLAPMIRPAHGKHHGKTSVCSKTEYYPVKSRCPRGFNPVNTNTDAYVAKAIGAGKGVPECFRVTKTTPAAICMDTSENDQCTLVTTMAALLDCTAPEIRIGNTCYEPQDTPAVPTCPPPFTEGLEDEEPICERQVTVRARLICPVNYVLKDGTCVETDVIQPQICPTGARSVNHRCFVPANPIFRCPKGTAPSGDDPSKCVLRKYAHPVCPAKKNGH